MVSVNQCVYHGLKIVVKPVSAERDGTYLFVTGEPTAHEILVLNRRPEQAVGKLVFRLSCLVSGLEQPSNDYHVMPIDLAPDELQQSTLNLTHPLEGQVIIGICHMGAPENFRNLEALEVEKRATREYPDTDLLCAYKVFDKTTYDIETGRFEHLQEQIKSLEKSLTTQIDQTIRARLTELGFKSDVAKERAKPEELAEDKPNESYIR